MTTTILDNVIGERGRAKFTIYKTNSYRYYFQVDSPYFNNSNYYCRFYIWPTTSSPTHYDVYKKSSTSYYYNLNISGSGALYHIHVYIEKTANNPIYLDEATFFTK